MPSDLEFSLLVWSRLSQISGGGLASPSTSLGATLVVMFRRQTDLHDVSLVGDSRVAHGEGGLASLLPKLDAIVEAGFCLLCFMSFSEWGFFLV